jgi:hypothetical protein
METTAENITSLLKRRKFRRSDINQIAEPEEIPGYNALHIKTIAGGSNPWDEYIYCDKKNNLQPNFDVVCLHDSSMERLEKEKGKLKEKNYKEIEINTISTPNGRGGQTESLVLLAVKKL